MPVEVVSDRRRQNPSSTRMSVPVNLAARCDCDYAPKDVPSFRRTMLDNATKLVPAHHPGRWVIHTRHAGQPWRMVVESDSDDQILMIVPAYPEEVRP